VCGSLVESTGGVEVGCASCAASIGRGQQWVSGIHDNSFEDLLMTTQTRHAGMQHRMAHPLNVRPIACAAIANVFH
jgi:hypothetical protein